MTLNLRQTIGPTDKKVFLAGEGPNDLGGWQKEPMYRDEVPYPGILEMLLRKTKPEGWMVVDAIKWQYIRKYRFGENKNADKHNVEVACLKAKEKGCDVIAFSRDSDGDEDREVNVQKGIESASTLLSDKLGIIGGCAVPCIEGWVLAILGIRHTESLSRTRIEAQIIDSGIEPKNTAAMVEKIEQYGLANVPDDACSLKTWLKSAQENLLSAAE